MTIPSGLRVLLVEDEIMVALLAEAMLGGLGHHRVSRATRLDAALELARSAEIDVAMLDINLGRETSFPVATVLRERGVPFFFATGYGIDGVAPEFNDALTIEKPFLTRHLADAIAVTLDRAKH